MIGKILRGERVQGLIRYLYGPGRNGEHRDPHIVAGFRSPPELEPDIGEDGGRDFRRLDSLLTQPLALLGERNYRKPVWHLSLRAAPEDPVLTDDQWAQIAEEVMSRTGLAPAGDPDAVRWIAVRHADDHIHIVATLARQDGGRPEVWNDGYRVRDACRAVEKRYGLRSTAPADRTAARRPKRGESEKAARQGWSEPPRVVLRREVQIAAAGARTEEEFFDRLRAAGILVRQRFSRQHPEQLTGYAVALAQDRNSAGQPVWYGGGKLAADLTLPKLRHRWATGRPRPGPVTADYRPVSGRHLSQRTARAVLRTVVREAAERARTPEEFFDALPVAGVCVRPRFSERNPEQVTGYAVALPDHRSVDGEEIWYSGGQLADDLTWPRLQERWRGNQSKPISGGATAEFTAEEVHALYEDAARAAAYATAQLRRYSVINPHAARDACWAAADALNVVAAVTGNRDLRRAANSYDRAARPPYGRLPAPTAAGDILRTAARLLEMANSPKNRAGAVTSLVIQLVHLMESIAYIHRAQQRVAQAVAANAASSHLRSVVASQKAGKLIAHRESEPAVLALTGFPARWHAGPNENSLRDGRRRCSLRVEPRSPGSRP